MTIDRLLEYLEFYKKSGRLTGKEKVFADDKYLYVYENGEETMRFNCDEK